VISIAFNGPTRIFREVTFCAGGHIDFAWDQYGGRRWTTEGAMTVMGRKFLKLNFLSRRDNYAGADLEALSDKCLEDIGFRLARRDLSSIKPFWLA
jgi:hypothetical protein